MIVGVIIAGAFIGTNNTLVTTAVMSIAPVERPVASATYGFVRFIGGGLAPFVAGLIVEAWDPQAHLPFFIAAVTVAVAAVVLSTVRKSLAAADRGEIAQPAPDEAGRGRGPRPGRRRHRSRRRRLTSPAGPATQLARERGQRREDRQRCIPICSPAAPLVSPATARTVG